MRYLYSAVILQGIIWGRRLYGYATLRCRMGCRRRHYWTKLCHTDNAGGVETIKPYVDRFLDLAEEWDQNTFLVTRIGCGIAGFTPEEIAPLFDRALDMYNVVLPKDFFDIIVARRKRLGIPSLQVFRKNMYDVFIT